MCHEDVALALRFGKALLVHEESLRVGRLDVHGRLDYRVDLSLDVVRLVDHERYVPGSACGDLAHDPEQLERVDRAGDQVVVRILPIVEVEAAHQSFAEPYRNDLTLVPPLLR